MIRIIAESERDDEEEKNIYTYREKEKERERERNCSPEYALIVLDWPQQSQENDQNNSVPLENDHYCTQ